MLLRHTGYYLLARGLPGVVNFVALVVFTRLLAPEEFGRYALAMVGVGFVQVLLFQWLQIVLTRFVPAHSAGPEQVLRPVLAVFLSLTALVCTLGLVLVLLWPDPVWRMLIGLAVLLAVVQSWLQMELSLAMVQLAPGRYGRLLGSKSILALLLGAGLAWLGMGAQGLLIGLLAGALLAVWLFGGAAWRKLRPSWPQRETLRSYAVYGLPLVVTFALAWAISSTDRLFISWLLGAASTGQYAVGYDFAQHSLGLILMVVATAAYPLVLKQYEDIGETAAVRQMARSGELITALALSGAAGLIALAPLLVQVFIGEAFRVGALTVLPWIAAATAVGGIKAYYFDMAFHLVKQPKWLVISGVLSVLVNVLLNLVLIPAFGLLGAAWATLIALLVAAICSGWFAKRVFPMPGLLPIMVRGGAVAGLAYLGAWLVQQLPLSATLSLCGGVAGGAVLAMMGALALNVAGVRESAARLVQHYK